MNFLVERLDLFDATGHLDLYASAPRTQCEAEGVNGAEVLAAFVKHEGGVEITFSAAYSDGQAVILVKQQDSMFALRAVPLGGMRHGA